MPLVGVLDHPAVASHVLVCDDARVAIPIRLLSRIEALHLHAVDGPLAATGLIEANVQKDAVHGAILCQYLGQLLGQIVLIGAGQIQRLPTRGESSGAPLCLLELRRQREPLRVGVGRVLVPLHAQIDRRPDTDAVQGLYLFAQQVQIFWQGGVAGRMVGGIVEVAVMAFAKDGHAVHVCVLKRLRELRRVEIGAHVWHQGPGVKVEVDRPEWKNEFLAHLMILSRPSKGFLRGASTPARLPSGAVARYAYSLYSTKPSSNCRNDVGSYCSKLS